LASTTTHVRRTVRQLLPLACHHLHTVTVYIHCFPNKEITSYQPRGRRDDMLPADLRPSADGSAVRTSLVAAAGSQRADSIGSCATQPACYSLGWDRQMDGSRYCLMPPPPIRQGHNKVPNSLRNRGHNYLLTQIESTLFKNSFIRCLFSYI